MSYDVKEALDEILEMDPIYRRDYIIGFMKEHLPKESAKYYLVSKDRFSFLKKLISEGYTNTYELLEIIGSYRVKMFVDSNAEEQW